LKLFFHDYSKTDIDPKMDIKKLQALITLLDDPDAGIYLKVESELLKGRVEIVPDLEKAWETSDDGIFQKRVENIIHSLQFRNLKKELTDWKRGGADDLLYASYLIAKYNYPDLRFSEVKDKIEKIKRDIWLELNGNMTFLENISVVNYILFDKFNFSRNTIDPLSPRNNFINDVLSSRKGNPVTLSVVYSLICQSLGMPVYGVNLPKNFILVYLDGEMSKDTCDPPDCPALFYINPVNKGAIIGKREIEIFLKQQKITFLDDYFTPCSNRDIVRRMFDNLRFSYDSIGQNEKKIEIIELEKVLDD